MAALIFRGCDQSNQGCLVVLSSTGHLPGMFLINTDREGGLCVDGNTSNLYDYYHLMDMCQTAADRYVHKTTDRPLACQGTVSLLLRVIGRGVGIVFE